MKCKNLFRIVSVLAIAGCASSDRTTAPATVELTLAAPVPNLAVGDSGTITATILEGATPVTGGVVSWQTSDSSIATVRASGDRTAIVTAVAAGHATVTARLGSIVAHVSVQINPDEQPDGATISFIYTIGGQMEFIPSPPGATDVEALAINDLSQVVGAVTYSDHSTRAFLWSQSAGMNDLGTLPGNRSAFSRATSISRNGQVAGYFLTETAIHPFRWTAENGMIDIASASLASTLAWGINSAGRIVGETVTQDGPFPFIWSEESGIEYLSLGGNQFARALSINDAGQIAGAASSGNDWANGNIGSGAVAWSAAGVLTNLVNCGQPECGAAAFAINSDGVVAGSTGYGAFTWSLGSIPNVFAITPENYLAGTAINDAGVVAGNENQSGFFWSVSTGYHHIATPPRRSFLQVTGINNKNEIVGYAQ